MSTHVAGVGLGLFIIISLWITAIIICIVSIRTQKKIGFIAISIATVVTLILVFIPRESQIPVKVVSKVYDTLFIWRILLVILLGLSSVAAFAVILVTHLMEPRHAQPIKQWRL